MPSASPTAPAVRTGNGTLTDTPAPNPARQLRTDHFCILSSRLQSASQPEDSGARGPPVTVGLLFTLLQGLGRHRWCPGRALVSASSPGLALLRQVLSGHQPFSFPTQSSAPSPDLPVLPSLVCLGQGPGAAVPPCLALTENPASAPLVYDLTAHSTHSSPRPHPARSCLSLTPAAQPPAPVFFGAFLLGHCHRAQAAPASWEPLGAQGWVLHTHPSGTNIVGCQSPTSPRWTVLGGWEAIGGRTGWFGAYLRPSLTLHLWTSPDISILSFIHSSIKYLTPGPWFLPCSHVCTNKDLLVIVPLPSRGTWLTGPPALPPLSMHPWPPPRAGSVCVWGAGLIRRACTPVCGYINRHTDIGGARSEKDRG